jgi:hypothetical protein
MRIQQSSPRRPTHPRATLGPGRRSSPASTRQSFGDAWWTAKRTTTTCATAWLLAAGQGPGLSRVSRRRLRRWRRGRWREVGGQQGRGHQPDRGQGGQRQPIEASRGRGQASDQDGPADRGAQAGAEFGHAARQARDLALRLTSWRARTNPQLALPSCRLGWPRSRRRSKPRPGRSTHHSRRSTAPKVHWPSAARCQCGWTTTTPHASRAPGIPGRFRSSWPGVTAVSWSWFPGRRVRPDRRGGVRRPGLPAVTQGTQPPHEPKEKTLWPGLGMARPGRTTEAPA